MASCDELRRKIAKKLATSSYIHEFTESKAGDLPISEDDFTCVVALAKGLAPAYQDQSGLVAVACYKGRPLVLGASRIELRGSLASLPSATEELVDMTLLERQKLTHEAFVETPGSGGRYSVAQTTSISASQRSTSMPPNTSHASQKTSDKQS